MQGRRQGEGSGEMEKGSGEMEKGSGEMEKGSGDMEKGSGEMEKGDGDMEKGKGKMDKGSGDMEEDEESTPTPLHEQDEKHAGDDQVSFMTMDDDGNVVDIFGLVPSDDEFVPCLECYNEYLSQNMKSWKKALGKIAKEIGQSCRPKCGKKMPANKKLKEILKAHVESSSGGGPSGEMEEGSGGSAMEMEKRGGGTSDDMEE